MPLATFSGNGNYQIDVDAAFVGHSGLSSNVYWRMMVIKRNTTGHRGWGNTGSNGWVDGNPGRLWTNGNMEYNFQNGSLNGDFMIAEGTFNVPHRGDGNAEYYIAGGLTLTGLGSASVNSGWRSLPRIQTATVPGAPYALGFADIGMTQIRYNFSGTTDGGSPIREWQVHYGTRADYGEYAINSWGSSLIGGLQPGRTYYFWSRGRNDIGWGPWSGVASARTFAGARIKHQGQWREAVPYVKHNGAWKLAQPYSKVNGIWRKSI